MPQIYFNGTHLGNIICLQKNISGIETLQSDLGAPSNFFCVACGALHRFFTLFEKEEGIKD